MKYLLKYIHECCFRLLETHSCTLISLYASCTFSPLFLYHKPSLSSDCTLLHTVAIQNPQLCIQYEFFSSVDLYSLIIINQSSFTAFNLSFCTSEILLVGHVSLHYMLLSVSQVKKQLVQIFTDKSWVYLIFLYCNSNIVKALIFIQRQFQLFYRRYCFISPSVLNENIQIILPCLISRFTEQECDEMFHGAPVDSKGNFNYVEFTRIIKHGSKEEQEYFIKEYRQIYCKSVKYTTTLKKSITSMILHQEKIMKQTELYMYFCMSKRLFLRAYVTLDIDE